MAFYDSGAIYVTNLSFYKLRKKVKAIEFQLLNKGKIEHLTIFKWFE